MDFSNPSASVIIVIFGFVLIGMGISKLIKHCTFMKKPHEAIYGEIVGCEKEIHHYRLHTVTLCRAKMRFEYNGRTYDIMDENAVPERIFGNVFSYNLKHRIRITGGDAYTATLDYAECLNVGRNQGFLFAGIGLAAVIIGLL
ncbi:MAG: hypothetical protein IKU43_02900 [Clostridia bacterium]|nr:hypothetical protein [Clostridia bacterium]